MAFMMLGTKIGMTRVYTDEGVSVPVTAIKVGPCVVTQVRTDEVDGYSAVQIGFGEVKARNSTIPMIAHDAKAGSEPLRTHREFRVSAEEAGEFELGQELTVDRFETIAFVDVAATSKGKGYAGVMKRHNFAGMEASHGTERMHRHGGSIGGGGINRGTGPKVKKGKKMSGRMGGERVTVRSLEVVRVDKERGILLVKGPVPGAVKGTVEVRVPTRLYKSKARRQAEKAGA